MKYLKLAMPSWRLSERSIIWLAVVLAALIPLVAIPVVGERFGSTGDYFEYVAIAKNLEANKFYSFDGESPTRMRQPGYPLFLWAVAKISGFNTVIFQVVQIGLNILTLLLLYRIAGLLFGKSTALISLLLLSVYPPLAFVSLFIESEVLFIFFFTLTIYSALKLLKELQLGWALLLGASVGAATLTRPASILLILLLPLWLRFTSKASFPKILGLTVSCWLCFVVVLLPWAARNHRAFGEFSPLSSSGFVMWTAAQPEWRDFLWEESQFSFKLPRYREIVQDDYHLGENASRKFYAATFEAIRADPVGYLLQNSAKTIIVWSIFPGSRLLPSGLTVALSIVHVLVVAIGLWTLVSGLRKNRLLIVSLSTMVYFSGTLLRAFATPRYLVLVLPLLVMGFSHALGEYMSKRTVLSVPVGRYS